MSGEHVPLRSAEEGMAPVITPAEKYKIRNAIGFSPGAISNPRSGVHSRYSSRTNLSDVPYLNHQRRKLTLESLFVRFTPDLLR